MPNINDRIGSQNVIRVLSNASAPPTKLTNLTDVDSTLKTVDGMILVWDLGSEQFIMTSVIDSSSTTIEGIAYFQNTTDSSSDTTGALIVSGGVGIAKNLNVGANLNVTGISTFASNLDVNASVDVSGTFKSVGVTTLASAGGITTTGGSLFVNNNLTVGQNLKVDGTSEFIGVATFRGGTINLGDADSDDINVGGEFVSNLTPNDDATYDLGILGKRWRNARLSGLVTTTDLFVSGLSTFIGAVNIDGDIDVDGNLEIDDLNVSGIATFAQDVEITGNLTVNGTQTVLNTNILEVEDINIGIASATPKLSDAALDGAGITIHGLAGDKTLTWDNSNSRLAFNTDVYAPNYYAGTFDGPNGIAYFDNSGKLTGAASTQSGVTTTNYILTTNASGLPVWTTTIDGGEY